MVGILSPMISSKIAFLGAAQLPLAPRAQHHTVALRPSPAAIAAGVSHHAAPTPFSTRPHRPAVRTAAASPAAPAAETSMHTLPDGMRLELVHIPAAAAAAAASKPPLLFIHGSYHGAWCWAEHWMPYFAAAGYDTYAISVRGQGGSDRGNLKISGTLDSHADDLASVISALPRPPVLVGHSFGGLLVEKYASRAGAPGQPPVAGWALVNAVPPSGNKDIVVRITKRSFMDSMRITWGFIAKSFAKSSDDCRHLFFSADLPEETLLRYQAQLAACSPVRLLDLGQMNKEVPLPPLPPAAAALPAFVAGGVDDMVVDPPAVEEAARYFGVQPALWENTAHDCMLDTRWEAAAASLRDWLDASF